MAREAHKRFFELLTRAETRNTLVTKKEIIERTGWKDSSFNTYLGKGQLPFLSEIGPDQFQVFGVTKLTLEAFSKLLSQSKHRRELGHNCKSSLARALLRKSRENMILALELYNRPSLENRLDAFVLLFCTSWEQLLKAKIIEKGGEGAIFESDEKRGRQKETISLRKCLELLLDSKDPVRMNVERIKFYRDKATHLLMPEIQFLISRVFQSGVLNYSEAFEEFAGQPFIEQTSGGLMSLVGDFTEPDVIRLTNAYGNAAGADVFALAKTLEQEIEDVNDIKYAIPLDIKLVFARNDGSGKYLAVSKAEEGMKGLKDAVIVEKPVDRSKTHPYKTGDAADAINKRLYNALSRDALNARLTSRNKNTGAAQFSRNDFLAIVEHFGWKNDNNPYHYRNIDPEYHYYSERAVEEVVREIANKEDFLSKVKSKYFARRKVAAYKTSGRH